MGKLLKLKEWLTVPDAARHLSIALGEEVSEPDVLRFALDGHLKLSVNFVNPAKMRRGKVFSWMETEGDIHSCTNKKAVREDVTVISGVWDLPMIGRERLDTERLYQKLTGGPAAVTLKVMGNVFIEGADGVKYQLQEDFDGSNNYYPKDWLPDDCVFVVRTTALRDFEQSINDEPANVNRPLTTIERNSLLKLVIGMAMKGYSYDPTAKKNSAVADIAADLALLGLPLGDDTIRKYLKQGNEQLPAKPANT